MYVFVFVRERERGRGRGSRFSFVFSRKILTLLAFEKMLEGNQLLYNFFFLFLFHVLDTTIKI